MNNYESVEKAFLAELEDIVKIGREVAPRDMTTVEQLGCGFRIANPHARLVLNRHRKWSIFYALGELLWHLAGSNDLASISYYSKKWLSSSDDGTTVRGSAYGHTLFATDGNRPSQWMDLLSILQADPNTRRAVISLYDSNDLSLARGTRDVPCTCSLHFFRRNNAINLISYTRSNDIILGFCYDIFIFTMLQELLALHLGCEVGWYQHMVGSLHLYDKNRRLASRTLMEGHSIGTRIMPPMSHISQIEAVIKYEQEIRIASDVDPTMTFQVAPYWENILLVLSYYKLHKIGDSKSLHILNERLRGTCYHQLLNL